MWTWLTLEYEYIAARFVMDPPASAFRPTGPTAMDTLPPLMN